MFNVKIEGLEGLQKHLDELAEAVRALDGKLCDLQFDPSNEESVRDAISKMEITVDARIARWRGNPAVREIAEKSKNQFRERILKRARGEE